MEGQVGWIGAPFSPDFRTMAGQISINIESGSFEGRPGPGQAAQCAQPAVPPRRLSPRFPDVFSEGFAFDFVRGDMLIDQGVAPPTTCR